MLLSRFHSATCNNYEHGFCRCHVVEIALIANVNICDGYDTTLGCFGFYFSSIFAMTCSTALVGVKRFILSIKKENPKLISCTSLFGINYNAR